MLIRLYTAGFIKENTLHIFDLTLHNTAHKEDRKLNYITFLLPVYKQEK